MLRGALEHEVSLVEKRRIVEHAINPQAKIKAIYALADEYGQGVNATDLMLQITTEEKLKNSRFAARAWIHTLQLSTEKNPLKQYHDYLMSIKRLKRLRLRERVRLFSKALPLFALSDDATQKKYYLEMVAYKVVDQSLVEMYEDFLYLANKLKEPTLIKTATEILKKCEKAREKFEKKRR